MFDFFISHSSEDKNTIVEPLVTKLKNRGYNVWYDKDEILVGDNIPNQVQIGLKESYCLILILTDSFIKKIWTIYEMSYYDSINSRTIVPIIYNLSVQNQRKLFNIIDNKKYINANDVTQEEILNELLRTLNKTKAYNKNLVCIKNIENIQHKIASFETANSDLISLKIKEYLDFVENHQEYVILAAQKVVLEVVCNLLEYQNYSINPNCRDFNNVYTLIEKNKMGNNNFREYVHYIFSLNTSGNYQNEISIINNSLENILTYFLHTRYPIASVQSNFEIVLPDELTYENFVDMYEIDKKVMRDDLIASVETTYGWFMYNNYTHIAIRETSSRRVVGYFSILPINDDTYNLILTGNFQDKDFNEDSLLQYNFSDFYKIYVAGVGIDPKYQNTNAFIVLYNALIDLIISLAKDREIYISEVLAEASTKQGEKFCKMVGMKKTIHTPNETDVYRLVTIPPQFRLNNNKGKELFKLCREKFEEYRDYFTDN